MEVSSYKQQSETVKGRQGQKEPQTTGQFFTLQFGFMVVSRPPPRTLSSRGTSPKPVSFPRAPLTLPLGQVPSSLGPARGWCQSPRCAGAAVGPTLSSAARPAAGATRNPPAPPERPGSPCRTQTQRHRPQTPVEGQRAGNRCRPESIPDSCPVRKGKAEIHSLFHYKVWLP